MSALTFVSAALLTTANALPQWPGGSWGPPGGSPWHGGGNGQQPPKNNYVVSLGPRPYYIVQNMTDSALKTKLESCENLDFEVTGFTIGHRGGGTLQFPEETAQSEQAGARMGAGILECDVSFTGDRGLVCRHSLCDLHTTTDILVRPELAKKCVVPFTPANASSPEGATAVCCTSDITTAEYETLCGKQDAYNASARTPQDYLGVAPDWRTELYDTCGKVLTLDSYIDLVESLPVQRNFTPELKTPPSPWVPMPFHGYTQQQYAQDFVDTFKRKGISYDRIWPQSFLYDDILYWLKNDHEFGKQAIFLQEYDTAADIANATANLTEVRAAGVNIIGPSIPMLVQAGGPNNDTIVPSAYSKAITDHGFDIIAWTYERSGPLATVKSRGEYYFSSIADIVSYDGQYYNLLDVLANQIKIKGLFTDWAASVTYFANCFGLQGPQNIYK
ncbi:Extracellular protein [Pseudocercospora fuligena]|uniref:glycerophosphodiester phosphodiesterase n=1 Tax=Pseudocercospora fuligena TaxID=685502 RepID=A0A8H6VCG2_9PEZI|nr:Extracellular protein [Pseudocercospora fuligena]